MLTGGLSNLKYPVVLETPKKRSTTVLSQQAPTSPMLNRIDGIAHWCIENQGHCGIPGLLVVLKLYSIIIALQIKSVVMRLLIYKPMIQREYKSITMAKHIQPSPVFR
jgi:hypothetical protein